MEYTIGFQTQSRVWVCGDEVKGKLMKIGQKIRLLRLMLSKRGLEQLAASCLITLCNRGILRDFDEVTRHGKTVVEVVPSSLVGGPEQIFSNFQEAWEYYRHSA